MVQSTTLKVLLTVFGHSMLVLGANYYVSTTGSDSSAGTSAAAFLTLARAQVAVRLELASQTSDIYVYVADGTYELSSPLNLTAADSGQNDYKVIWQAQGSSVNLSGGFVTHALIHLFTAVDFVVSNCLYYTNQRLDCLQCHIWSISSFHSRQFQISSPLRQQRSCPEGACSSRKELAHSHQHRIYNCERRCKLFANTSWH